MAARIQTVDDGRILLDGGAMFGVVPRVLWEKSNPPDESNRITLGLNCLLVEGEGYRALIDTGVGSKGDERFASMYGLEESGGLPGALASMGLSVDDITHVINTHLHFDHCGGNTRRGEGGKPEPTFPRARYVVQKKEWELATDASERSQASYLLENYLPVKEAGQLDLVEGETEILPGLRLLPTPGHTLGHQSVLVEAEDGPVFYAADLIPTSSHLPLPWIMAYDLHPVDTLETKRRILDRARDEQWRFYFEHEPGGRPFGDLEWVPTKKGEKPIFRPLPL